MKLRSNTKRFPIHRLVRAAALLSCLALVSPIVTPQEQSSKLKSVLIIYDENNDFSGLALLDRSLTSALKAGTKHRLDIYSEFMDRSRFPGERYEEKLREIFRLKYAGKKIDLIIAVMGPSLDFALKRSAALFPGTPIVFCGIDSRELKGRSLRPNVTGVIVKREFKPTLELALRLQPNTKQVVFIGGISEFDRYWEQEARQEFREFEGRVAIKYLSGLPMDELQKEVARLPPHTIILYLHILRDSAGNTFKPNEALSLIAQKANAPIYVFFDQYLGYGVVGGHVYSLERHGAIAAQLGLRVLGGEKDIPLFTVGANVTMLDWRQLRRWGIGEDILPPDAYVLYKEPTIWNLYEWQIIGVVSLCIVEGLLIFALLAQRARRRRVEEALSDIEARLKLALSAAHIGDWDWRVGADELNWSDEMRQIFGLTKSKSALTTELFFDLIHQDDRPAISRAITRTIDECAPYDVEFRTVHKDGSMHWVMGKGKALFDKAGQATRMLGVNMDITETKQAELNTHFINQLDFELSQIADADEIIRLATSRLGEYLGVSSCYVIEVNPEAGLAIVRENWNGLYHDTPNVVGEYRISDYTSPELSEALEAGQPAIVKDVMTDPRTRDFASKFESLKVGAFISIPVLNEKQWEASLTVNHPQARDWRPDETQLMRDIAARLWPDFKRARVVEALRESEERLRLALEAGRMGAWEWDTRTNAIKWSKEHYTIMGLLPFSVEPDYQTWADRVHPDDLPVAMEKIDKAIEEKGEYRQEYRIIRPDGSMRWVEGRGQPVYNEDGQCFKVRGLMVDITERKKAEDALRQSQARYRAIVEDQTELVCRLLPDGSYTFVNEAYCRYFGRSHEELIGGAFLPFIPAEEHERINHFLAAITPSNPVATIEHQVLFPDGGMRWHQWTDRGIFDEQGRLLEFQCVGRDITKRKQAEERLMESEAQLRLLTELIPQHIWTAFPGNDADYRNQRWLDYTGMTIEEARGKGWMTALHPDDHEPVFNAIQEASSQRRTYEVEVRLRGAGAQYRWFLARAIPQLDQEGNIIKWFGTNTDIEDRKQAEEALRLSEDKFSKAFRSSPDAFAISRQADGMILEVNGRWEEISGYTRDEAVGRTVSELQIYLNPSQRAQLISLVRERGFARDFEGDLRKKSGEIRNVSVSAEPIMIRDEPCLMLIVQDISERKQAVEALRKSEEALRKSHTRIEDLAGRLIAAQEEERRHIARELHDDLNQQVAALAISISRLKRLIPDAGAAVQEQIARLMEKTDWLSERIRQVSHELHCSILQHVGLPAALNSYCAEFSDREGIAVTLDIRDGVETVSSDAALCLYRVAQESLRNIARHSGARSAVIALARVNGAIELRVADQGVGFDQRQAREGRGLGLVSMEERVKLLHGNFVLTTQPGAGTELRAQIPLRREHEQNKSTAG